MGEDIHDITEMSRCRHNSRDRPAPDLSLLSSSETVLVSHFADGSDPIPTVR